jgi:ribosome-associated translation inhibitor RaiA
MDIFINAKDHVHQEGLKDFYSDEIEKKYNKYPFVKTVKLNIRSFEKGEVEMALIFEMEKGGNLFSKAESSDEAKAFKMAIKKIDTQVEKYKETHYWKHN